MYLRWYIQLPAQFAHAPSALHVHLVLLEGPPCMYYSTFNCQLDSLMHPQYALHVHRSSIIGGPHTPSVCSACTPSYSIIGGSPTCDSVGCRENREKLEITQAS